MVTIPTDPLFREQWYLNNTGQGGRTPGIDLNVTEVWDDYTGDGVAIAILDDAVERSHEDLDDNFDSDPEGLADYNYDFEGAPFFQDDDHGTAVAGIIAAENNAVGIIGVAFDATITAFSYYNLTAFDASPIERQAAFDISNNSWGVDNPFQANFDLPLYRRAGEALEFAAREGRGRLGTVFVWAAGNEFEAGASSNYGSYEGSRFTIAVAAIDGNGIFAPYSVQGSNLLVSAFGDGDPTFGIPGTIVTTDRTGSPGYNGPGAFGELSNRNYTNQFNGTSSAAPMVSGVVALMLDANSRLGYRDVQEILAYSARQNDPSHDDWVFNGARNWNGGGLHTNLNYGFGLVDALTAVRLAETWTAQSTYANETVFSVSSPASRLIADNATTLSSLQVPTPTQTDHVEVDIDLSHFNIEDLIITLISPDGTRSMLFNGPGLIDVFLDNGNTAPFSSFANNPSFFTSDPELLALGESYGSGINFTFSSTTHWGETGQGTWQLEIEDTVAGVGGRLNNWNLRLYGDALTGNDTYIYTDAFATLSGGDRQHLSDTGGQDTLNAAAITSDLNLRLKPGATSTVAGRSLTIEPDTAIERVFGGDGDDKIRGNSAKNRLWGERGNDVLAGKGGNDVLVGSDGNDVLRGSSGKDRLVGNAGNDRLIGGGDSDRLIGGAGNDRMQGGGANDILKGGGGRDRLNGGKSGNDVLRGGGSRDVFVLKTGQGKSQIRDFKIRQGDRLKLGSNLRFNALDFTQQGTKAIIRVDNDTLAVLNSVQVTQLDADIFV